MFTLCYLWQVYLCSYHLYGSVSLPLFQVYSYLQVQPGEFLAVVGRIHLGNLWWDGDDALCLIGWSTYVVTGLATVHPDWMSISFHHLTIQQIGAGGGGAYMQAHVIKPFVIGCPSLWVAERRPPIWMIFAKTRPLTCWQEMCLKLLRIVFATMSIVNSYNCCNYFTPSIILITSPMSIIWCWDEKLYCMSQYWIIIHITKGTENTQEGWFWSSIQDLHMSLCLL